MTTSVIIANALDEYGIIPGVDVVEVSASPYDTYWVDDDWEEYPISMWMGVATVNGFTATAKAYTRYMAEKKAILKARLEVFD